MRGRHLKYRRAAWRRWLLPHYGDVMTSNHITATRWIALSALVLSIVGVTQ